MNNEMYPERNILSIDLKSFFASCECVERNLDPFTTPLVVANPKQGDGAITLAVTPYLKKKGIKSRGRIYEIPKTIAYAIVPPRMSMYIQYSEKVISVYLDYVAREDIHVYSIDECFLDVTSYLKLYKKTDYELAEEILSEITKRTGLTATCGIGPNILLAKIAMDVEAKKFKNGIAKWEYKDIPAKLWTIKPLSKMWGIGPRMEKRLNQFGIYSVGDLAKYDVNRLKDKYGVMGVELWEHANGIDLSKISDLSNYKPKDKSYSNSQVLFKDYYGDNVRIIIQEMVDMVSKRLRLSNKQTSVIGLAIGYSKSYGGGFYHVMKLDTPSDNNKLIMECCMLLFDRYYTGLPIRKVGVSVGRLSNKDSLQLNLFEDFEKIKQEEKKEKTIDEITNIFGKNSLLKASSLLEDSTVRDRNKKIGGHSA
ncbi:MAG: Y-family DNA polymerase [Candidatus Coprovivens sp.]